MRSKRELTTERFLSLNRSTTKPKSNRLSFTDRWSICHYADPSKVLLMAQALKVCPPKIYLIGCQPEYVDDAVEGLRPPVARAVPLAAAEVLALIDEPRKN